MVAFIQSFCKSLYNYGCYFFCLISIAEEITNKSFNVIDTAVSMIKKGYIQFNWKNYDDPDNFYVKDPCAILYSLTGLKFTVTKENASYKSKAGDYIVEYWKNGSYGHFARIIRNFNSLQVSQCVNKGKIDSYRVFRKV